MAPVPSPSGHLITAGPAPGQAAGSAPAWTPPRAGPLVIGHGSFLGHWIIGHWAFPRLTFHSKQREARPVLRCFEWTGLGWPPAGRKRIDQRFIAGGRRRPKSSPGRDGRTWVQPTPTLSGFLSSLSGLVAPLHPVPAACSAWTDRIEENVLNRTSELI